MSSEREPRLRVLPADPQVPDQVGEATAEFRIGRNASNAIDNDTRLSSADETTSIWPARPARHSVLRSLSRSVTERRPSGEPAAYRGDGATSHSRRDVLTGDWTIFAPKRDERPNEYASLEQLQQSAEWSLDESDGLSVDPDCPFCSGSEGHTPDAVWTAKLGELSGNPADVATNRFAGPEVHVVRGDRPDWDVRVVPNKFPAVSPMETPSQIPEEDRCLFPVAEVVGGHEVIIESAQHAKSLIEIDSASVYMSLLAYRDRIRYWRDVPGIQYISVFKNCGPEAGASLRHSHSQLISTSLMPHRVRMLLRRCESHRARTGCSLGCDLLRAELAERTRVIDRTDQLVAFCPFASRFAGMVRITSVSHQPHFDALSDTSLDQLASFLWRVLHWIDGVFPGKAYNFLLHTCPPAAKQPEAFQWSLDLFPRLSKTAGFEWSSDCMINALLPESAASGYRQVARRNDPRNVLAIR